MPSASALTWEASGIAYSRCSAMKAALSALALSYILETMEHVSLNSTVHTHIHTSLKKRQHRIRKVPQTKKVKTTQKYPLNYTFLFGESDKNLHLPSPKVDSKIKGRECYFYHNLIQSRLERSASQTRLMYQEKGFDEVSRPWFIQVNLENTCQVPPELKKTCYSIARSRELASRHKTNMILSIISGMRRNKA